MATNPIAPFYQLGRHITCSILQGSGATSVAGEVMDTDSGWIAVKDAENGTTQWYNLDHIVQIQVQEPDAKT